MEKPDSPVVLHREHCPFFFSRVVPLRAPRHLQTLWNVLGLQPEVLL